MFDNYWFQTGTPTYLVELVETSDYDLRLLIDGLEVGSSGFAEYRAEAKNPLPMIYQSGYLTIKNFDKSLNLYTLGFPNDEVKYGFLKFLIPYYTPISSDETDLTPLSLSVNFSRARSFFYGTYEIILCRHSLRIEYKD